MPFNLSRKVWANPKTSKNQNALYLSRVALFLSPSREAKLARGPRIRGAKGRGHHLCQLPRQLPTDLPAGRPRLPAFPEAPVVRGPRFFDQSVGRRSLLSLDQVWIPGVWIERVATRIFLGGRQDGRAWPAIPVVDTPQFFRGCPMELPPGHGG